MQAKGGEKKREKNGDGDAGDKRLMFKSGSRRKGRGKQRIEQASGKPERKTIEDTGDQRVPGNKRT